MIKIDAGAKVMTALVAECLSIMTVYLIEGIRIFFPALFIIYVLTLRAEVSTSFHLLFLAAF
jgi:hypothetical protein